MKNILQQLYYGELYESENIVTEMSSQRMGNKETTLKAYEILMRTLSAEQKALFNKWQDLDCGDWSYNVEAAYIRGFKIGAQIIIEVHRDNKE